MMEFLPADLARVLPAVRRVGVVTGAGISRECGIPTYRGEGGLYDDPELGARTVEALSIGTLERDPDRTWKVLADLARTAQGAMPSAAHRALADLERRRIQVTILTQNVDGLHQRAGSRDVIEIHGNVFETRCVGCGRKRQLAESDLQDLRGTPHCRQCNSWLRPAVVLFGEQLDLGAVERMVEAFHESPPDLVVAVGTSALFPYILRPLVDAASLGIPTVEVNPERTPLSEVVGWHLRESASVALPLLTEAVGRA